MVMLIVVESPSVHGALPLLSLDLAPLNVKEDNDPLSGLSEVFWMF
jgi:hypothetical protein